MNKLKIVETKKDHYRVFVDGKDILGEQERSDLRHLVGVIDNGINTGI
jgi:hypothetical protein